MSLKKNYLLAYNATLIFGWALVLARVKACITLGPKHVYENVHLILWSLATDRGGDGGAPRDVRHRATRRAGHRDASASRLMVVWGVLMSRPRARAAFLAAPTSVGSTSAWGSRRCSSRGASPRLCVTRTTSSSCSAPSRHAVTWMVHVLHRALLSASRPSSSSPTRIRRPGEHRVVPARSPNPYNISIHFPSIVVMFFLGYVPGFPMLYSTW